MRRFCRQPEEYQTMIDHIIGAIEGLTIFLAGSALVVFGAYFTAHAAGLI